MAKRTIVGRTQFLLFFIFLTSPSPGVAVGRTGRRSCFCTPRTWNIFNSSSSIVIITITRPLEFLNWLGKRNCFFLERQHCQLSSNYIHNCLNLNWAEQLNFFTCASISRIPVGQSVREWVGDSFIKGTEFIQMISSRSTAHRRLAHLSSLRACLFAQQSGNVVKVSRLALRLRRSAEPQRNISVKDCVTTYQMFRF